jgi:hypothetical protein
MVGQVGFNNNQRFRGVLSHTVLAVRIGLGGHVAEGRSISFHNPHYSLPAEEPLSRGKLSQRTQSLLFALCKIFSPSRECASFKSVTSGEHVDRRVKRDIVCTGSRRRSQSTCRYEKGEQKSDRKPHGETELQDVGRGIGTTAEG